MNNYSLIEKLKILMDIIVSSPLFLFCIMLALALLIFYIICIKKEKKVNKWLFISIWLGILLVLIIKYNNLFLNIINNLFDQIFMAIYFPNITVYLGILLISNFTFIYSLIKKENKYKIVNLLNVLILDTFFIIIIDIVNNNRINIYDNINIFTNSNLLVLLELSSAIFISWILICLFISAYHKLQKYDKEEKPEIVFEEV